MLDRLLNNRWFKVLQLLVAELWLLVAAGLILHSLGLFNVLLLVYAVLWYQLANKKLIDMANYRFLRNTFGFFAIAGILALATLLYLVYLTAKLSLLIAVICCLVYVWASIRRWWNFHQKEKGIFPAKQKRYSNQ